MPERFLVLFSHVRTCSLTWKWGACITTYRDKRDISPSSLIQYPQYADSLNLNNGLYIIRIWLYIIWHWLYIIGSRRDYRNCNILRLLLPILSHKSHTRDGTLMCPLQFSYVFAILIFHHIVPMLTFAIVIRVCNFNYRESLQCWLKSTAAGMKIVKLFF